MSVLQAAHRHGERAETAGKEGGDAPLDHAHHKPSHAVYDDCSSVLMGLVVVWAFFDTAPLTPGLPLQSRGKQPVLKGSVLPL